jgi:hypothetical protein
MTTIQYAPDGTTSWTAAAVLTLCNTSRSITELDVKFNHKRSIQTEPGFGAAAAAFFDNQNQQNTLSLKVRRSVDFTSPAPVAFPDPEGALAFALQQPTSFPTTGALRIQLAGAGGTNTTLYLLNCGVQAIALSDWLGEAPAFEYTFTGGLISTASPF